MVRIEQAGGGYAEFAGQGGQRLGHQIEGGIGEAMPHIDAQGGRFGPGQHRFGASLRLAGAQLRGIGGNARQAVPGLAVDLGGDQRLGRRRGHARRGAGIFETGGGQAGGFVDRQQGHRASSKKRSGLLRRGDHAGSRG
jgi:hypothetical protein